MSGFGLGLVAAFLGALLCLLGCTGLFFSGAFVPETRALLSILLGRGIGASS